MKREQVLSRVAGIRVSERQYRHLKALANEKKVSTSTLCRVLLEQYLREETEKQLGLNVLHVV